MIADLTECHPYYVQQLAKQTWLRTERLADEFIVNEAFNNLVLQRGMIFQALTDGLSNSQVNFIKALICNELQLSSKKIVQEYQLGTSANVLKINPIIALEKFLMQCD